MSEPERRDEQLFDLIFSRIEIKMFSTAIFIYSAHKNVAKTNRRLRTKSEMQQIILMLPLRLGKASIKMKPIEKKIICLIALHLQ